MDIEHAAVGEPIIEQRVRDQRIHAGFVGLIERFAAVGSESDRVTRLDEIAWGDHAGVDGLENGRFGDQWTERFHQVERERGAAEAGLVIEAQHGIEAGGIAGKSQVFGQHTVSQGQKCVDRIAGRAAIARLKVEGKAFIGFGGVVGFEHVVELAEVETRSITFDTKEFFKGDGCFGTSDHGFHLIENEDGRFIVIAHEHSAVIANLAGDEFAGQAEAEPILIGKLELRFTEEDVFRRETLGDAIEPTALGEVADGHLGLCEGLHSLGRDLNVTHEIELVDLV